MSSGLEFTKQVSGSNELVSEVTVYVLSHSLYIHTEFPRITIYFNKMKNNPLIAIQEGLSAYTAILHKHTLAISTEISTTSTESFDLIHQKATMDNLLCTT